MEENNTNIPLEDTVLKSFDALDRSHALCAWQTRDYEHHERSRAWIIGGALITAILFCLAIWSQNIFAAVVILLLVVIVVVRALSHPLPVVVEIYPEGVLVGESFIPFKNLQNFWMVYNPPITKRLYLEFNNKWRPRLPISLENEDPNEVRKILLQYLKENTERENEPISDYFGRILKL